MICEYVHRRHGSQFKPEHIIFLPGLGFALNIIARMAARSNQAVMTTTPIYPPFMTSARNAGTDLYTSPLALKDGKWSLDLDNMQHQVRAAEAKGRSIGWYLLCNPHNPVGKVYSNQELELLAEFCERNNINMCSDEVHADIIYRNEVQHIPYENVSDKKCITINSPSKAYNVAGLTTAFGVSSDGDLRRQMKREMKGITPEDNVMGLAAMEAAYTSCEPWLHSLLEYLQVNRDLVIKHFGPDIIEGDIDATYMAWINARKLYERTSLKRDKDSVSLAESILGDFGIGLNCGSTFGPDGVMYGDYVRLNFGCSRATLEEALSRIDL